MIFISILAGYFILAVIYFQHFEAVTLFSSEFHCVCWEISYISYCCFFESNLPFLPYLADFNIFSLVVSILLEMLTYAYIYFPFYLSYLGFILFLNMLLNIFPQCWQTVSHYLYKYYFYPIFSSNTNCIHFRPFIVTSKLPILVYIFYNIFSIVYCESFLLLYLSVYLFPFHSAVFILVLNCFISF